MSAKEWKVEKDLCRCCHGEGSFRSLYASYIWRDVEVVYSNMLQECFGIELTPVTKPSSYMFRGICNDCIQRLYSVVEFKRQVEACERRFRELYLEHIGSDTDIKLDVKEELPDYDDDNIPFATVTADRHNGAMKDDLDSRSPEDGGFADHNVDFKFEDEEDAQTQCLLLKKHKRKRSKITSAKVKKKVERPKKKSELIKDDNIPFATVTADRHNGAMKDDLDSRSPEDGGFADHNVDFKFEDEEDAQTQCLLLKKHKRKRSKITSAKVKKKVERPKKKSELIKGVKPPFDLKEGIDYKFVEFKYQCCRCEKTLSSATHLSRHVRTTHLKHTCSVCSKVCKTQALYIKHKLEEHNIDERQKCNACDNVFSSRIQLRRHFNNYHMLGNKIKCSVCDYETFSVESLYKHKFKHKTVKDYHCAFCRKAFLRKSTLQLHERIHTGDRRKVCKVCGQAFVQKASLNYHMTKYHPGVVF